MLNNAKTAWAAFKKKKYHIIIPFTLPSLALFLVFVVFPYGQAMYYSLTKWRGLTPKPTYIGLANFEKLLGDAFFWNALKHNLIYLVGIPPHHHRYRALPGFPAHAWQSPLQEVLSHRLLLPPSDVAGGDWRFVELHLPSYNRHPQQHRHDARRPAADRLAGQPGCGAGRGRRGRHLAGGGLLRRAVHGGHGFHPGKLL